MRVIKICFTVFVLSILFVGEHAQAAYLVYTLDENGKPQAIDEQDQKLVYDIIDDNSWPNNLDKLKNLPFKDLPESVTSTKSGAEEKYIEQKLEEKIKGIHLLWVPTTLFQMAYIWGIKRPKKFDESMAPNLYFQTNELLIKDLFSKRYPAILDKAIEEKKWEKLLDCLVDTAKELVKNSTSGTLGDVGSNTERFEENFLTNTSKDSKTNILTEIFKMEIISYLENGFTLYRSASTTKYAYGTNKKAIDTVVGFEDSRNIVNPSKTGKAFGISIANTLFAGHGDITACTFHIFSGMGSCRKFGKPNLYALNIKKLSFLKKYKDILYWPKSSPIMDIYSSGEYFHPRTFGENTPTGAGHTYIPKTNIITEDLFDESLFDKEKEGKMIITSDEEEIKKISDEIKSNQNSMEQLTKQKDILNSNDFDVLPPEFRNQSASFQLMTKLQNTDFYKKAADLGLEKFLRDLVFGGKYYDPNTGKLDKEKAFKFIDTKYSKLEEETKKLKEQRKLITTELDELKNETTRDKIIIKKLKEKFLEQNNEQELVLIANDFLKDYMNVIFDGKNVVEHHIGETEHPSNELYNNQIELGNLIEHKYRSGFGTKKVGGLWGEIKGFKKENLKKIEK